jgi:TPR repeat protein
LKPGRGLIDNFSQAIEELKDSAEKGEDDAQFLVGASYANAKPPSQDLPEAERWLKRAAAQGHVDAMHSTMNPGAGN